VSTTNETYLLPPVTTVYQVKMVTRKLSKWGFHHFICWCFNLF